MFLDFDKAEDCCQEETTACINKVETLHLNDDLFITMMYPFWVYSKTSTHVKYKPESK